MGSGYSDIAQLAIQRSGTWHQRETAANECPGLPTIEIRASQRPRQGVNTCGANDILIFERHGGKFRNGFGEEWKLEESLLFPLMNSANFGKGSNVTQRWVLLAYDINTGRPLTWESIEKYERVAGYLSTHREALKGRKGILINASIARGFWWSLLGVGSYSFTPWKVAWEALGRKEFTPTVLAGNWQGNQALHAFCPCATAEEARALASALGTTSVENWLTQRDGRYVQLGTTRAHRSGSYRFLNSNQNY